MTKIEFLGWKGHTDEGFFKSKEFINKASVIYPDEEIVNRAINLKRNYKIKLVDSIICSTALINKLVIVTRNTEDFSEIGNIKLLNPFSV